MNSGGGGGNYVSKSGDSMSGNLVMLVGSDVLLAYDEDNPSAVYGQDDTGGSYNLIGIRVYNSAIGKLIQVEGGSRSAQFNINSQYVPTAELLPDSPDLDIQYAFTLPAGKHRFALDTWVKNNFSSIKNGVFAIDSLYFNPVDDGAGGVTWEQIQEYNELYNKGISPYSHTVSSFKVTTLYITNDVASFTYEWSVFADAVLNYYRASVSGTDQNIISRVTKSSFDLSSLAI